MKLKRCKIQDVAYQDEKLRMQQIGAVGLGDNNSINSSEFDELGWDFVN